MTTVTGWSHMSLLLPQGHMMYQKSNVIYYKKNNNFIYITLLVYIDYISEIYKVDTSILRTLLSSLILNNISFIF